MLRLLPHHGKLISYDDLPNAIWNVIAPHFGLTLTDRESRAMAEAALRYSKATYGEHRIFQTDSMDKRRRVSHDVKVDANMFARPAFERLMSLR